MPDPTREEKPSRTGEFKRVEIEPRLEREPKPRENLPEIDIPTNIGSSTGIMKIKRESEDETAKGDEDNPL